SARDSAGDSSGGSGSIRGGSGGGGGVEVGGIFAPVPKRPDRSASRALAASLVESSGAFMSTTKRRADRTPSPGATTTNRRASYPSFTRPWNFADFRGVGSRSPGSPLPPRTSDMAEDVYDPGGGGGGSGGIGGGGAFGITRRSSTPPSSPAFSDGPTSRDGAGTNGSEDAAGEPPLFATVA
ncbi:unnamed protein product, partial [Laminaria digitata]